MALRSDLARMKPFRVAQLTAARVPAILVEMFEPKLARHGVRCIRRAIILVFGTFTVGCAQPRPTSSPQTGASSARVARIPDRADSIPRLEVQSDSIEVLLRSNRSFEFEIPFELSNPLDVALGLPGCRAPNGPSVETLMGSVWRRWDIEYDLCDSPPQYVDPGSTRLDSLRLAGCYQRPSCSPAWIGDSAAILRLVYRVYPTGIKVNRGAQLSRMPHMDIRSKPFRAVIVYRPCGDVRSRRGLLC